MRYHIGLGIGHIYGRVGRTLPIQGDSVLGQANDPNTSQEPTSTVLNNRSDCDAMVIATSKEVCDDAVPQKDGVGDDVVPQEDGADDDDAAPQDAQGADAVWNPELGLGDETLEDRSDEDVESDEEYDEDHGEIRRDFDDYEN